MVKMCFFIMCVNSLLCLSSISPTLFLIFMLLQSLLVCVSLWWLTTTSFISYILFLIYVGGLMVIFSYMCSLSSNSMHFPKFNYSFAFVGLPAIMAYKEKTKNTNISYNAFFTKMEFTSMFSLMMISILFLLMVLIIIVKITMKNKGAVRTNKK
uniref:NADH dehydrogenase subunit 6 n=1 Tax=Lipothrix lubbocki TaxID=1387126 RepID=A0A6H0EVY5_9HEXA|nr:NADH dehydrogenase subunit 6 [Lipothrix lubbocki]